MTVHVLHLDHTATWSGGEIALVRLLDAIDPSHITSTVICAEDGPLMRAVEARGHGARVEPLSESIRRTSRADLGRIGGVAGAMPTLLSYAARIARMARSLDVDVIHTNSMKAHLYGLLAGRLAGVPVLTYLRDDVTDLPSRWLTGSVAGVLRRGPRAVVGCSAYVLESAGIPADRSRIVYSGVPVTDVVPVRVAPPGPPVVGLVARIAPWKGQELFLEAAALVSRVRPDVSFRLIGTPMFGEDAFLERLRHLVARPPLRGRVEFRGFVADPREEVDQLTVAVATSLRPEPFGQTVVEAMARGVPVVAPAEGGPCEIVTPGTDGMLVPPRDPEALARAIVDLLDHPDRAHELGSRASDTVRDRFTVEANAERFTDVLLDVAA